MSTKILCALLLHLNIIDEIRVAKDMINYALKNTDLFVGQRFLQPIRFGFMKFFSGFLCMVTNLLVLQKSPTVLDSVKDFVCLKIVMDIGGFVAITMDRKGCEDIIENEIWIKKK